MKAYGQLNAYPTTADSVDAWLDEIKLVGICTPLVSRMSDLPLPASNNDDCTSASQAQLKGAFQDLSGMDQLLLVTADDLKKRVPTLGQQRRVVCKNPVAASHLHTPR